MEESPVIIAAFALAAFTAIIAVQAIYRLYFHPLSIFPGPRTASMSRSWLRDKYRSGQPEKALEKVHREYDTKALRVAPNELHITDVNLYKTIYSQSNQFPKVEAFYSLFSVPHSLFGETDQALHRERRKLLSPLFSTTGVAKLEPVITEKLHEMGAKIRRIVTAASGDGAEQPIEVNDMVRCLTVDVISEFAFGQSAGLLSESDMDFQAEFLGIFDAGSKAPFELYFNTAKRWLARLVPPNLVGLWDPKVEGVAKLVKFATDCYRNYTKRTTTASHPIVFDVMRSVPEEFQPGESLDILLAGSDTTAYTLTISLFRILREPKIRERLIRELREALPDGEHSPSYTQLAKIEYLSACVKETLRIATPVPGILPRIVTPRAQPLVVEGKIVPPGTIIGISAHTMNHSTELWGEDANQFNPGRWLGSDSKHLDSYLCSFSKGARQCIGINIAYTEATMALAYLFRNFDMTLKTTAYRSQDYFTQQILKPGVLVSFSPK